MVITDAVAVGRQAEARHALHKAGGEPAEAAVPQSGVGLEQAHPVVIDAEVAERPPHHLGQPQIAGDVVEQPADQELEREVIDALAAAGEALAVGGQPAVNDAVAQSQRGCDKPVPPGGARRYPCRRPAVSLASTVDLNCSISSSVAGRSAMEVSPLKAFGSRSRGSCIDNYLRFLRCPLCRGPVSLLSTRLGVLQASVASRCRSRCGTKPRSRRHAGTAESSAAEPE